MEMTNKAITGPLQQMPNKLSNPNPMQPAINPTPMHPAINPTPMQQLLNPTPLQQLLNPTPLHQLMKPSAMQQLINPSPGQQAVNPSTGQQAVNPSTGQHEVTTKINPIPLHQLIRHDRSMITMSDDNMMVKQIHATHAPDGREFDVKPLFQLVEDILNRATPGVDPLISV